MESEAHRRETPANLAREFVVAMMTLSRWSLLTGRGVYDAETRARALVFLPMIGLLAGVLIAVIDRSLGSMLTVTSRSFLMVALMEAAGGGIDLIGIADLIDAIRIGSRPASTGIARIGPLGAAAAIAWFVACGLVLARIADPAARAGTLVMTAMLSRWTPVPVAYGLRPLERWGLGVPHEGAVRFREFSISSAFALGLTMALYENVGLAVIVVLALMILALRLVMSRRLGGAAGYSLAGAMAMCMLMIPATVAVLVR